MFFQDEDKTEICDKKEEEDEDAALTALAHLTGEIRTQVVESDILTAQDILSFEMLDIRDRNPAKVSQTATPNNTPLGQ